MAQTKTKPKYYLDSSVLIAWLTDEKRPEGEMEGVYDCFERIENGKAIGVISSATWSEIVLDDQPPDKARQFRLLVSGRRIQEVAIDTRVGTMSGQLRQHYAEKDKEDGGGKLTTADAQHLAAAIHYQLDAFYTFDTGRKPNREDGGRSRSLLSLSGNVAGHDLTVCKPPCVEPKLDFESDEGDDEEEAHDEED